LQSAFSARFPFGRLLQINAVFYCVFFMSLKRTGTLAREFSMEGAIVFRSFIFVSIRCDCTIIGKPAMTADILQVPALQAVRCAKPE
jgi:hypothetical protein